MGYSLWGGKELDKTKQLTHTHTHTQHKDPGSLFCPLLPSSLEQKHFIQSCVWHLGWGQGVGQTTVDVLSALHSSKPVSRIHPTGWSRT